MSIDRKRVYITGYSMGGEGAFDFLTRRPHLFAAAIPICPVADTARARFIYQIPVWTFHGDQDDVNDVKYSRLMIAALKKYNGTPRYIEYSGFKHNIWSKAYNEPGLFDWLFSLRRRKVSILNIGSQAKFPDHTALTTCSNGYLNSNCTKNSLNKFYILNRIH